MTTKEALIHEIENAPDELIDLVGDQLLEILRSGKMTEGMQSAIASQSVLDKIWLDAEEDEAWRDL
ncbi:MAG: DUF2281 domain-containing protein [Planctomycetes bacterium]|nr:DUF2281 domain-containing protein [Planctomycetota bacterium]